MWTGSAWVAVQSDPRVDTAGLGPTISTITPSHGVVGTQVVVRGSQLGRMPLVQFGTGVIGNVSSGGSMLTFSVPASIDPARRLSPTPCMLPSQKTQLGSYDVSVKNTDKQSNIVSFTVVDGQ